MTAWCRTGSPAGIVDEFPTCGIFPTVAKPSDPRGLTRFVEEFTNYSTMEDDPAAAAKSDKLIASEFVDVYTSMADVLEAVGRPVLSKLKMVTNIISIEVARGVLYLTASQAARTARVRRGRGWSSLL